MLDVSAFRFAQFPSCPAQSHERAVAPERRAKADNTGKSWVV